MEETKIGYKLAKLAKEKGFDLECIYRYQPREFGKKGVTPLRSAMGGVKYDWNHFCYSDYASAPTQSLLQKWLRKKHNLHVNPSYNHLDNNGSYMVWFFDQNKNHSDVWYDGYSSYEQALENGLIRALNMI